MLVQNVGAGLVGVAVGDVYAREQKNLLAEYVFGERAHLRLVSAAVFDRRLELELRGFRGGVGDFAEGAFVELFVFRSEFAQAFRAVERGVCVVQIEEFAVGFCSREVEGQGVENGFQTPALCDGFCEPAHARKTYNARREDKGGERGESGCGGNRACGFGGVRACGGGNESRAKRHFSKWSSHDFVKKSSFICLHKRGKVKC